MLLWLWVSCAGLLLLLLLVVLLFLRMRKMARRQSNIESLLLSASQDLEATGKQLQRWAKDWQQLSAQERLQAAQVTQERPSPRPQALVKRPAKDVQETTRTILSLIERGEPLDAIADQLGLASDHIRLICRVHGVQAKER